MEYAETITIGRGNTEVISVPVVDEDGIAYPLEGFTCTLYVKKIRFALTDDPVLTKVADVADIVSNVATFRLSGEETDIDETNYIYEVYITNTPAVPTIKKTVAIGVLTVQKV